jgi:hypothetical protein
MNVTGETIYGRRAEMDSTGGREVCRHGAPLAQRCGRCAIDPRSLAGVLLREHDNAEQAAKYADRKADLLRSMGNAAGLDYAAAAKALRSLRAG